MRFFDRQGDQLAEHLLSDRESVYPKDGHDETLLFVRALPAAVPVPPDPALEAEMIPALAGAARSASLEASRVATTTFDSTPAVAAPRWRQRLAVLAAAVAVLPILMAGLAYAGVGLPDAVDDAFEAIGVDLPNQSQAGDAPAGAEGKGDRGKGESASKNAAGTQGSDEASAPGGAGAEDGKGKPEHAGPEATPPGHGATPPGQGGVPPGNAGVPPGGGSEGSTGPPPETGPPSDAGPSVAPPSEGGTPPGQGGTPPDQG
jgi:hypothetical protein